MKNKHRNFWSFFWRVGAGFLAFYLAVMGVFTYVTAQRKLDEARENNGDYSSVFHGGEYWLNRGMAGGRGGDVRFLQPRVTAVGDGRCV